MPDLDDALQAVVQSAQYYDWHPVAHVRPLPSGFVAHAFALQHGDRTVFVKCYDRQRAITARMLTSNQFSLPVTAWLAQHTPLAGRMAAPLATRSVAYHVDMGRFVCVAFDFWAGSMPCEAGLTEQQVVHLATTIAWLHHITPQVPMPNHVEREDFTASWADPFWAYLTDQWQTLAPDVQAVLASHRPILQTMLMRFRDIGSALRTTPPALVLCHTDIHCMNMLVEGDTTVLLDFEGLKLAPIEHDIMFVRDEPYWPAWYAAYQAVCGATPVDPQRLRFYQERRLLEDIYEWIEQTVHEHPTGQARHDILDWIAQTLPHCRAE